MLARAVELDSRNVTDVSVNQLRDVATEAGIASDAFERALREVREMSARNAGSPVSAAHPTTSLRALTSPATASQRLATYRRHFFVVGVVAIAALTRGDVISWLALSLPLSGLYELGILIAKWHDRRDGQPPASRGHTRTKPSRASRDDDAPPHLLLRLGSISPAI